MTWKLFGSKHEGEQHSSEVSSTSAQTPEPVGKGRPTPKRKQAEAKNLHPIVPKDRKASRKAAKQRLRAKEDAQYEAMRTGDITHMPKAERLPWRIYIRDYVDARLSISEFTMPIILVFFVALMVGGFINPVVYTGLMIAMYVFAIAVVIDLTLTWFRLKKKLIAKFGERSVAKGSRSATYAWTRGWQLRRWRIPKPNYPKRGHWPE